MKTLCLARHARASQQMSGLADIDRPLTESGYQDAHALSKKPQIKGIDPQLIITSPGIRALTTALIFARNLDYPAGKVVIAENLYNAPLEELLQVIAEIHAHTDRVILFGHNPSITNATNLLVSNTIAHIPTCGISCIDFEFNSWHDIRPRSGKLRFFEHP